MGNLSKQEQDLSRIAALQKFDGSFTLDDRLASTVGVNIRTLEQACAENSWNADSWATTVVLAFFVTRVQDLVADWELLADKSKLWLSKDNENIVEDMFSKALGLFPK